MQCPGEYELELYLDGELPPARQEELTGHLADCPACGGMVASLRREGALLSSALAATPLPFDLAAVIEYRMVATVDSGKRWLWFFLPALCLAAMSVALNTGWWPLFEKLRTLLNLLGFGDLLLQFAIFIAGILEGLADAAVRGKSVLPALTVLILCLLWTQLELRKGGKAHV